MTLRFWPLAMLLLATAVACGACSTNAYSGSWPENHGPVVFIVPQKGDNPHGRDENGGLTYNVGRWSHRAAALANELGYCASVALPRGHAHGEDLADAMEDDVEDLILDDRRDGKTGALLLVGHCEGGDRLRLVRDRIDALSLKYGVVIETQFVAEPDGGILEFVRGLPVVVGDDRRGG